MSDTFDDPDDKKPKKKRGPRKVSPTYLENSAAYYLGRFSTSSANLRRVMMRKIYLSATHHGTDTEEAEKWLDALIEKFERLGYLDDKAFAQMRARGLHARGTPLVGIKFKLMKQGVGEDDIAAALTHLEEENETRDLDWDAAIKLARRRRLGPYGSHDLEVRKERREKDMSALARAGFGYDIAQRIVEATSIDELEEVYF